MPLKNPDPFISSAGRLNAKVNPYVALLRDGAENGDLPLAFGAGLSGFPGHWRERIAAYHGHAPYAGLVVEIGCHKGHTLLAMAAAYPDVAFLGLDITYKRVVMTAQRAKTHGHKNVFTAMANATALDKLFAPGEIDGCLIFFPDPWVKKQRQAKNRLVDVPFCDRLGVALRERGLVWLKTDQDIYFDGAAAAFAEAGFEKTQAASSDLFGRDFTSSFEKRFHAQNLPTFGGQWMKRLPMP